MMEGIFTKTRSQVVTKSGGLDINCGLEESGLTEPTGKYNKFHSSFLLLSQQQAELRMIAVC